MHFTTLNEQPRMHGVHGRAGLGGHPPDVRLEGEVAARVSHADQPCIREQPERSAGRPKAAGSSTAEP